MDVKSLFQFRKPGNQLEGAPASATESTPAIPEDLYTACPACKHMHESNALKDALHVCPHCAHHMRLSARARIDSVADTDSFEEFDADLHSKNILAFPSYDEKLKKAKAQSEENEGVITGHAQIDGLDVCLFAMESAFMMGSMGTVVGEKITRLFEYALEHKLSVIAFTVSGGARMQEGILSLMQMAKTSAAIKRHSDAGLLYIAVLTDPTTGGVTASFAMEGDITIAEPGALIGFAGPRVIEQTIRQTLPDGFQSSEFLLEKGFVDMIVKRSDMKCQLSTLLQLHGGCGA